MPLAIRIRVKKVRELKKEVPG
jgi:hypothetical protein